MSKQKTPRKPNTPGERKKTAKKTSAKASPLIILEPTTPIQADFEPIEPLINSAQDSIPEYVYDVTQIQNLESRLKRKDILLNEQQKKIQTLKKRITRIEEEARNRNQTITSYQTELIQYSRDLDERQKQIQSFETQNLSLHEQIKTIEKEKEHLRTEFRHKTQDYTRGSRELKESKQNFLELRESFDIILAQNTELDQQITELKRIREETESRYSKTLDNLKAEVRLRQAECSKLMRDTQIQKQEREELERLIDGIELKIEMLSNNNDSLQKKLDLTLKQKNQLEEHLNHWFLRKAYNLVNFFAHLHSPSPKGNTVSTSNKGQIV